MPTNSRKVLPVPQPTKIFFDPFNSSSTGHQTAPNTMSGSTAWRQSRTYKLSHQFRDQSGHGGTNHLSDLVGAGSENYKKDGRKENGDWEKGAPGLREGGWQDIRKLMQGSRKRRSEYVESDSTSEKRRRMSESTNEKASMVMKERSSGLSASRSPSPAKVDIPIATTKDQEQCSLTIDNIVSEKPEQPPQIFRGLTIYLNGSTAPLVSDHRLRQLFATHGGNSALALGRRTVTHVILGKTCGGGLAASKMQKEITTVGGKGIKFVTAQWVLDSIEKGIRQPEGRYQHATVSSKIGGSGQKSVAGLFLKD